MCKSRDCLFPKPCPQLEADHSEYLELLARAQEIKGVKKVFIRSGIRYDYMLADREHGREFLKALCQDHVSGILKVAPEHASGRVLDYMGKCCERCISPGDPYSTGSAGNMSR